MPIVKIRLFGAFRNLQSEPELQLEIASGDCTAGELKNQLAVKWRGQNNVQSGVEGNSFDAVGLLQKSALADETTILHDDQMLDLQGDRAEASRTFALLPPVSGG